MMSQMFKHPCLSLVSMRIYLSLLLFVVGDNTLQTSMFVNLFFPCFYGRMVTVLCRYGKFIFLCLYVWQVLLSEVMKDAETSYLVWEFIFPVCRIENLFFLYSMW